jgi:PKD repeat protein
MRLLPILTIFFLLFACVSTAVAEEEDQLGYLNRLWTDYTYGNLIDDLNGTTQEAVTDISISELTAPVESENITALTTNDGVNLTITNDTHKITILDNSEYKYIKPVAILYSDVEPYLRDDNSVLMVHESDETGEVDATWIQYVNNSSGYAIFSDLPFSTVTIYPHANPLANSNFENWTSYSQGKNPDLWVNGSAGEIHGMNRSTDAASGNYSFSITSNTAYSMDGHVTQEYTPGVQVNLNTYAVKVKNINCTQGKLVLNGYNGVGDTYHNIYLANNYSNWTYVQFTVPYTLTWYGAMSIYTEGVNTGGTVLVDCVELTNSTAKTATETSDSTHYYQNYSYTPAEVYSPITLTSNYNSTNFTNWTNITSVTAKIDGTTRNTSRSNNTFYVDASGLSVASHAVNITITYTPASTPAVIYASSQSFGINTTSALTDYQLKTVLNNTTGVSTGSVIYTNGTTQADWDDIKFNLTVNDVDQNINCPYWLDPSLQTASSIPVFVKIPSIYANNTTGIKILYGNATTTTALSNGSAVFDFYDGFDEATLNSTSWLSPTSNYTVANGKLTIWSTVNRIIGKYAINTGTQVVMWSGNSTIANTHGSGITNVSSTTQSGTDRWQGHLASSPMAVYAYNGGTGGSTAMSPTTNMAANSFYTFEMRKTGSVLYGSIQNSTFSSSGSNSNSYVTAENVGYFYGTSLTNGHYMTYDYVAVRKYAAVEPTFRTLAPPVSAPVASFTKNNTGSNIPFGTAFTDSSTNTPTSWSWNFGDGTANSTEQNPTHQYTTAGTHIVILTAINAGGSHSTSQTITALPAKPVAGFTGNTTSGNYPLSVAFTDSSTNTPTSWAWSWGDGTANGTTQNPTHTYTTAGTYTVTLTATNAGGSGGYTRTNYITVGTPNPVANFTANATSGAVPKTIAFTDSTTNSPTSWAWSFGDGTNSTSQNPTHTYSSAGVYTVILTATNAGGSNAKTRTNYITISTSSVNSQTQAAIIQMQVACENSNITPQWNYAEQLSDNRGITFGFIGFTTGTYDGNILIKYYTTLNATNSLAEYIPALDTIDAGAHNYNDGDSNPSVVGLTGFIADVEACSDPLFKQAQVYEMEQMYWQPALAIYNNIGARNAITMSLLYDASIRMGADGAEAFADSATAYLGGTPGTGINETVWDNRFLVYYLSAIQSEDGTDEDRVAAYTRIINSGNLNLTTPYQYTVYGDTFTITGDLGFTITSATVAPVASFTKSASSGTAPLTVTFTDTSTNATSWAWNFGDGTANSTSQHPSHQFTTAGTRTVTLTATNDIGSSSTTQTVTVGAAAPTASFAGNRTSGSYPLAILFTDSSAGSPTSWAYNFGDGSANSTSQNPVHVYSAAGTYTVIMTATSAAGSGSLTRTNYITITTPAPVASFTKSSGSGSVPITITFTDTSTNSPTAYEWDFGDGSANNTMANPSHQYTVAGTYIVTLTVTNSGGSSTTTQSVTTSMVAPVANFGADHTSGQKPFVVHFSDTSSGVPTSWAWNFGNGQTSTAQNPTNTYSDAGTYTVTLTATNAGGSDAETKTGYITVSSSGVISLISQFSTNHIYGGIPLVVNFTDTSMGTPTGYMWYFGDSNTSQLQSPQHTYYMEGTYTVTLVVSKGSDTSTSSKTITVKNGSLAPENYSQYMSKIFQPNMTSFDFRVNIYNFYNGFVGDVLMCFLILCIPLLTQYIRQGSAVVATTEYLVSGGIMAVLIPAMFQGMFMWFTLLAGAAIIYKMFISD